MVAMLNAIITINNEGGKDYYFDKNGDYYYEDDCYPGD
jgi:hypothetical protein